MPPTGVWTAKLSWEMVVVVLIVVVVVIGLGDFADNRVLCGGLGAWQW